VILFDIDSRVETVKLAIEKIVLLSVAVNDAAAAKEVGAAFTPKSASPDELVATLTSLLRKE